MTIAKMTRFSIVTTILLGLAAMTANAKPVKDTPVPADGQCDYVNYFHNEAKNPKGPATCASDCDCDGTRSCVAGKCTGTARPVKLTAEVCNNKGYHYQEAWTKAGPGKCAGDCECDGLRNCTNGECTGTAR